MNQLYCFFILFLALQNGFSQACLPDSTVKDSAVGVYPKPISPTNPNGGINKPACINKPFEFNLTVKISDTVTIPGVPIPVNLNFAKIPTKDAISGLPKGIGYECNPPDCIFPKNSIGCLILKGTPTSDNTPGIYRPVIKITLSTLFGNFDLEYPGQFFPGEYLLTLLDEKCNVSTRNPLEFKNLWYPAISSGMILNPMHQSGKIELLNSFGQKVWDTKSFSGQQFDFPTNIPDGMYLICWTEQGIHFAQKILLQRG